MEFLCKQPVQPYGGVTNILPFDHTRVILRHGDTDKPGADYINANYINYETDENLVAGKPFKQYIASQGCVSSTRADFWQMVWQEECRLIVMTTKVSPGQGAVLSARV